MDVVFCCYFLLLFRLFQGSSLPSPFQEKKNRRHTATWFFSFLFIFFVIVVVFAVFETDGMLQFKVEKNMFAMVKKCPHRRRFVVVPFRNDYLSSQPSSYIFQDCTFFYRRVCIFYIFKCMRRLTWKTHWIHSFPCIVYYTQIFQVTFDIFVPRTCTKFLLIWIRKIFYFLSSSFKFFFAHSQLLLISWTFTRRIGNSNAMYSD